MGDMVYTSISSYFKSLLMMHTSRFGADFDMMHDGYDAKGIWHIIENGMV